MIKSILAAVIGRLTLAAVASVVSLVIFARFSAEFAETGHLRDIDMAVLEFCSSHQVPLIHQFAYAVSWVSQPWGQALVAAAAAAAFSLRGRFWPQGGTLLIAAAGGGLVIGGLKLLFHRPRPEEIFAPLGYSFPSGHTFMAVVVYGLLAYWIGRDRRSAGQRRAVYAAGVTAMFLVGASRIYLGQHFPSDVGAGFSSAVPWVWLCLSLPSFVRHLKQAKKFKENEDASA